MRPYAQDYPDIEELLRFITGEEGNVAADVTKQDKKQRRKLKKVSIDRGGGGGGLHIIASYIFLVTSFPNILECVCFFCLVMDLLSIYGIYSIQ